MQFIVQKKVGLLTLKKGISVFTYYHY